MDKVKLFLTLLTVGIIVGPLLGIVIMHRDDLSGIIITPEMKDLFNNEPSNSNNSGVSGSSDVPSGLFNESLELPQYVNSSYDPVSRMANFSFSFTNPFGIALTLNAMSANASCTLHGFHLGVVTLISGVNLGPGESVLIPLSATWTQEAVEHLSNDHAGENSISIDLTCVKVNVSGISVDLDEKVTIPNVPLR